MDTMECINNNIEAQLRGEKIKRLMVGMNTLYMQMNIYMIGQNQR